MRVLNANGGMAAPFASQSTVPVPPVKVIFAGAQEVRTSIIPPFVMSIEPPVTAELTEVTSMILKEDGGQLSAPAVAPLPSVSAP